MAGTLWPLGDDARAAGNLRSALWRLKGCGIDVVETDKVSLWLRPETVVDVELLGDWATRMISGHLQPGDLRSPPVARRLPGAVPRLVRRLGTVRA